MGYRVLTCVIGLFLLSGCGSVPGNTANKQKSIPTNEKESVSANAVQPAPPAAIMDPYKNEYQEGAKAFSSHDYPKAVSIADDIIKKDKNYEPAYNMKGIAIAYEGNYHDAMSAINEALHLRPDDGYAIFNKALTFEIFAYYDDAISTYKKALAATNNGDWWKAWSYYGISSIYGRRGDVPDTVSYLAKAIAINPSIKGSARTETDFNNVRNSKEFNDLLK